MSELLTLPKLSRSMFVFILAIVLLGVIGAHFYPVGLTVQSQVNTLQSVNATTQNQLTDVESPVEFYANTSQTFPDDWTYRKSHVVINGTYLGENYRSMVTVYYNNSDPIWDVYKNNPVVDNGADDVYGATGTSNIVANNGTYHLYTSVSTGRWERNLRHFTSTDPEGEWTPDGDNPVLSITANSHGGHGILKNITTGEPLKYSESDLGISGDTAEKYWLFYAYGPQWDIDYKVYIATNDDLDGNWTPETELGAVLECGSSGEWDDTYVGFNGLQVVFDDDTSQFLMIYEGGDGDGPGYADIQTGLATSTDLVNWTKSSANPIIPNGSAGQWDDDYAGASDIWKEDEIYLLPYRGGHVSGEETGFAYGTNIEDLTKNPGNPIFVVDEISQDWATNSGDAVFWRNGDYDYMFFEGDGPLVGTHYAIGWAKTDDVFANMEETSWIYTEEYGSIVNLGAKSQTDFDDIRFTASDGETLLNVELYESHPGYNATFIVELTEDLSVGNATIYIYYGNDNASSYTNSSVYYDSKMDFTTFTAHQEHGAWGTEEEFKKTRNK
jgi:hypothetical protein